MKKVYIALFTVLVLLFVATASVSAAEYVYYENDFSDPSTLGDFKQYRMEWEIRDGGLYLTDTGIWPVSVQYLPRVGIDYAGEDRDKPWRYLAKLPELQ